MTVKGSERDPEKTCNTEGCNAWATKQSDRTRCRNCGGESTGPKTKEGKKTSRMNALDTGVHSDPVNLFDWCAENEPEGLAYILNKLWDYSQRAPHAVFHADFQKDDVDSFEDVEVDLTAYGDDVVMMCIRDYARWRATKEQLKEGITTEQTRESEQGLYTVTEGNPVNLELDRMDKTTMRQKDKLGLLPSPESKSADADQELTALVRQQLED